MIAVEPAAANTSGRSQGARFATAARNRMDITQEMMERELATPRRARNMNRPKEPSAESRPRCS